MAKVNLNGKRIPLAAREACSVPVAPDRAHILDDDGFERGKVDFFFRFCLDKQGHLYIIPLDVIRNKDGSIKDSRPAYEVEDVIAAASGDVQKQKKINEYHEKLKAEFVNEDMMSAEWQEDLFKSGKDFFLSESNKTRTARGLAPLKEEDIPERPTTYEDLTEAEVNSLVATAKDRRPATQTPPEGKVQ